MQASKLLIAAAVAGLLQTAASVAQTPPPDPTKMPSHPAGGQAGISFDALDKDGDGRISKTEAAVNEHVTEQFARYDKNGNGYIEKEEVMAPAESTPKQ